MSQAKKQPAFYCPDCGQKHRGDLSRLSEKAGVVLKLVCVGCKIPLVVSLDAEGRPVCTREDTPKPEAAAPASKDADATASKDADAALEASPSDEPAPPADAQAEFGEGDMVGRYTIEEVIGTGATSGVYKAFDPTTNRSVGLKILTKKAPETIRGRFLREIEVQANIRHQNIMPVFDRGALPDGRPFFTMELLHKPWTLAEILQARDEGRLSKEPALEGLEEIETIVRDIIIPVSDGVYVANVENGVIHRDLKPDNVLVDTRTLRPYLLDFGICHVLERKASLASKAIIAPTTEDEGIVGTPRYLAPEQVRGSVHARTDVWGLGAMLHHVVAGEPPIANASNISRPELKRRIEALEATKKAAIEKNDERKIEMCDEMLTRLSDPSLRTTDDLFKDARAGRYEDLPATTPAGLRAVILKAMATTTADRYVNARQLNTDLQAWLSRGRVRALTEVGGAAAAVESARRAVRTHAVTTLWLVVGLLAGLGIAYAVAVPGLAPPSTRVADAEEDIRLLNGAAGALDGVVDDLTAVERHRLWNALDTRAQQIEDRLAVEPDVPEVRGRRERLAFERSRFQPPRVRLDLPASVKLRATSLVTKEVIPLKAGENLLPPGAYSVTTDGSLRFPIQVPLVIRTDKQAERVSSEPPREIFTLPMDVGQIPAGRVLVLGGRVLARDLPFNPPSSAATDVAPFLMDTGEVTNSDYAAFLSTLPLEERVTRGPRVAFVPDPEQDGAPIVIKGREEAPVVGLRAEDAMAYAAWRATQDKVPLRLPTEAEWVLAAGATLGHALANGAVGLRTEAEFTAPLRNAAAHKSDVSPYGARGLLGNAREMVTSAIDDLEPGAVLVKGAGVGDDPDQGAIYIHRILQAGERHNTTGFRLVQDVPQADKPQ